MFGSSRKFVLISATLVAISALLPVLPATLTAETEPRPAEIVPIKAPGEDEKSQKSAREKVAGNKLVIEKPAPKEPPPKPAPKEEPAPELPAPEPPAPEPPAPEPTAPEPVRDPDEDRKRLVAAGATRVPVLPGPTRKASEKPPVAPPVAEKAPRDNQLMLTVPRLGLEDVSVGDSPKQSYLDREGIMHLTGTGFPRKRGSNTYIAGHAADYEESRVPNVFRNLHTLRQGDLISLRDATGKTYKYRAYEYLVVNPRDFWVTEPVPGKQVVSFQTCFPAPTFERRLIVRAELVN